MKTIQIYLFIFLLALSLTSCGESKSSKEPNVNDAVSFNSTAITGDNKINPLLYQIDEAIVNGEQEFTVQLKITQLKTFTTMNLADIKKEEKIRGPYYDAVLTLFEHYDNGAKAIIPKYTKDVYAGTLTEATKSEYLDWWKTMGELHRGLGTAQEAYAKKWDITLF